MADARESLGEFESSIFDASDGHKLVDLIRRKKGLHVHTQKIFDDVPTQRPSLQIEFQQLDEQNETLQPDEIKEEDAPPTIDPVSSEPSTSAHRDVPPEGEFVPKSPRRTFVSRSVTSPIIKMSSTTLGRRTLLKEFEKAFLHESRFLPKICSTPITSNCLNQPDQDHENTIKAQEPTTSNSQKQKIVCSPITISDEGSPQEKTPSMENRNQTLKESLNTENVMRSLMKQNELLSALVQESHGELDSYVVNKENTTNKGPSQTYTVERDIATGKITLSPAKSRQNIEKETFVPKTPLKNSETFTRKLIATPEQRKVLLSRLSLGLAMGNSTPEKKKKSPQKASRIPNLSKNTNKNGACLTNQESATAEFVERLQKNATPNCPVIVIPVNQTFNQAPTNQPIPKDIPPLNIAPLDEITSTISDNTPKALGYSSKHKERDGKSTRIDSPRSNVISSTTISNGEPPAKDKELEPLISNLRWDDIITDDASTSDHNDRSRRQKEAISNERRRKLSKKRKPQTKHSPTHEKKLSVIYKFLDLRMRVSSDEESENNLQQKSQRLAYKMDKQEREEYTHKLHQSSRRGASKIAEQGEEQAEHNLPQRSRRKASTIDKQQQRSRLEASKTVEQSAEESVHDLPQQSRQEGQRSLARSRCRGSEIIDQCDGERAHNSPQRSRREKSQVVKQTNERYAGSSEIVDQCAGEREHNSLQRSRREKSQVDEQRNKRYAGSSEIVDQCAGEREHNSPQQSRREKSQVDEQRNERYAGSSEIIDQCAGEREHNSPQRSRREKSQVDKQKNDRCASNQRSQRESSVIDEQRRTTNIVEQCDEEHEHTLPQRAPVVDYQSDVEHEDHILRRSPRNSSKIQEQRGKQPLKNLTSKIDKQSSEKQEKNMHQQTARLEDFVLIEKQDKNHENNLQLPSRRGTCESVEQFDKDHHQPRRSGSKNVENNAVATEVEKNKLSQRKKISKTTNDQCDKQSFQTELLRPPDEFRDCTNSTSIEKDLVDENSSDRISLSQENFKRPSAEAHTKKKIRKKIIPEHVKQYLEADKRMPKTHYLNVSKRKLYSKGISDRESSDDMSFSSKQKRYTSLATPQKSTYNNRKSDKSSETVTSSAQLTTAINENVEADVKKNTAAVAPSKSGAKKKTLKKTNPTLRPSENETTTTTSNDNLECGPRRSKRESKPPTAYWCPNSQYTHVYDIYAMLTAGKKPYFPEYLHNPRQKKKDKLNPPSTDDANLVANTNTTDSSSKKNAKRTKRQTNQPKKKAITTVIQLESESESISPSVSDECFSKRSVDKTTSRVKTKSSKEGTKDKQNIEVAPSKAVNHSEQPQQHASSALMPPPKTTRVIRKVKKLGSSKKNAFHTEHDESIADVSSVHVNNLFDQLKNSSLKDTMANRSRLESSGQVSLDNRSNSSPKKRNHSNSTSGKSSNVSVRLRRFDLHNQGPYDVNSHNFDSGFSSEDMNSIAPKKDILLDWLVQMLNNGRTPSNTQKGVARFLQPNGYSIANADELEFEEIDGVDFAFYNSPGQKLGYMRFKPHTQKKKACAKRHELKFVLLGGTIQMTADRDTFVMRNGDFTTIFVGTSYSMRNITDDPALVIVIRE